MTLNFRFASAVYHARKERGITQEMAAEVLDISLRWYQHIEKGDIVPSGELVLKIIVCFEIDWRTLAHDVYTESR